MADRSRSLKLGLIGCGRATENLHLPALRYLSDAEVVALSDINPDRLKRVADRFHIRHQYPNFPALLDDPAVEAVAVCVPAQLHVKVALAALDAGKHLFIEKPLALSLDESDRLIERASHSSCKVMVGFNLRWHRLLRQARKMVEQGTLGAPKIIRTVFTNGIRYRRNIPEWSRWVGLGGGVLFEEAVHHFDLWRFLLQSEVEEVFAISRSEEWENETATVTARMANGVVATSAFSESTSDSNEVDIYGQAGRLRVSCYRFDGLEFSRTLRSPGDVWTRLRRITHVLRQLPQAALEARRGGDYGAAYRAEWRHFIDSIQQDRRVECTLEDGRRALQVALAALESAALGRPVKVAQAPRNIPTIAWDVSVKSQERRR